MLIEDHIWEKYIVKFVQLGMGYAENSRLYYDAINDINVRKLLLESKATTPHFDFLCEILDNPEYVVCPNCGQHNTNVDCSIIRCEFCDHEWKINTQKGDILCEDCIACKTGRCDKRPPNKSKEEIK